jgi:uncharacterized protein YpuA (DUF1002 family)
MAELIAKLEAKQGIDETKKVITAATDFFTAMASIDWKKVALELADLDAAERRELINLIAQKILAHILNILAK